ncbi:MAG: helix-turn-helix domain-containing protein [Actinomycetota bacterium]|nr:helix-turn-helix domain-containing protein [Actinomycetota bacterium]
MPDDEEIPELPVEEAFALISFIQPHWWDEKQDAVNEAMKVAEWLDFHIERRSAGEDDFDRPVQRLSLTVEGAAQALGISRAFAYEAVANGDIPCIRIGRRILVPKAALEKMINGSSSKDPSG